MEAFFFAQFRKKKTKQNPEVSFFFGLELQQSEGTNKQN